MAPLLAMAVIGTPTFMFRMNKGSMTTNRERAARVDAVVARRKAAREALKREEQMRREAEERRRQTKKRAK